MAADFSITGEVKLNSDPAERATSKWTVAAGQLIADFTKKAASSLQSVVKSGLDYNRSMESYLTNFKVMLGDEQLAAEKLEEIRRMAASTPFSLSDLTEGTQTLLQFGVAADDTTGVLKRLGDISLGNADKLQTLVRAYGKMSSAQKVTLENVNMMIDAGFNPLNQICDATGESMSALYKRISDGKVSVAYSHFLGYEKGEDGSMQVVESEAKIVQQIYGMFLDGQTPSSIASFLTKQRVPTPAGREKWQSSTVKSILTNEKYKGDALLQKTFTVDFLSKKAKINEGEVPQYYVEKSHPAIVSAEVFDLAQYEMKRRAKKGRHTSAASIFSDKLVCVECGAVYGSKVWHSTDAYRTMIWRCNEKYAVKGQPCPSPHLRDEEIQSAFVQAVNQVLEQKEEILSALQEALAGLTDASGLERECDRLQAEQDVVSQQMGRMIRENAEVAQNQAEYNTRLQPLEEQYEALKGAMLRTKEAIAEQTGRRRKLEAFMCELRESSLLTVFDERVFLGAVERITVFKGASRGEKRLVFRFKDGRDVAVSL